MKKHKDVLKQSSCKTGGRLTRARPRRRLLALIMLAGFTITILACTLTGPRSYAVSKRVDMLTRLPTFTRTPLAPLMVPGATVTPGLIATPLEPAVVATTLAYVPPGATTSPAAVAPGDGSIPNDTSTPDNLMLSAEAPPAAAAATSAPATAAVATEALSSPMLVGDAAVSASAPTVTATAVPLPTHTLVPTAVTLPADTVTATAVPLPTPTLVPTATPTDAPAPTNTPTPLPEGWIFTSIQTFPAQEGSLQVRSEVINNTGTVQDLTDITGIFYDSGGKVTADKLQVLAYWPIVETIPRGGQMPFELTIIGIEDADRFDLSVEAELSQKSPHQNFEFLEVNQVVDDEYVCIEGQLRNLGDGLREELIIMAVLFDEQDQVINFSDWYELYPVDLVGAQTLEFEICIDPLDQEVARHKLRAWGL